jgi:SET domain-containing protein
MNRYERQDALKKSNPNSDLPDFYNITMERPSEDPRGYDVLFVEGAMKATFASRLSHSCTPNCVNIPIIRNGRLEIHMYTWCVPRCPPNTKHIKNR